MGLFYLNELQFMNFLMFSLTDFTYISIESKIQDRHS